MLTLRSGEGVRERVLGLLRELRGVSGGATDPRHGWNCVDRAVLAVALHRAAGLPGYVVGGSLDGEDHAWAAVFAHDPNSKGEKKWHEIFIDRAG
jgi:transglutaminase-like putative cysteine protease